MGRTMPTNKARARAQRQQEIAPVDPTQDPEMQRTLYQEGQRRGAIKNWGDAMTGKPKKKRSLGSRIKRKIQRTIGLPEDD